MNLNAGLAEQAKFILAHAHAAPSGANPQWVSMKNFQRATVYLAVSNGGTVTTPVAVTLQQATTVTGTNAKALAFVRVYRNTDTTAADGLTEVAVTSNTFTMDNTVSKNQQYIIEVKAEDLDVTNGFDCFQVALANGTGQSVGAHYILWPARYGKLASPSAIVN